MKRLLLLFAMTTAILATDASTGFCHHSLRQCRSVRQMFRHSRPRHVACRRECPRPCEAEGTLDAIKSRVQATRPSNLKGGIVGADPYDVFDGATPGDPIAVIPWGDDDEIGRSPFGEPAGDNGLEELAPLGTLGRKSVKNFRGTGMYVSFDGRIFDSISEHNYIGAKLGSSDAEISRCRLPNNRDVSLWVAAGAGNTQSHENHCYGARIACYNEGSGPCRHTLDTFADSFVGYLGDLYGGGSNHTVITNCLFQHNMVRDVVFLASHCRLVDCTINAQREVIENDRLLIPDVIDVGYLDPLDPDYPADPVEAAAAMALPKRRKVSVVLGHHCSIEGGTLELLDWKHPANTYSGRASDAIQVDGDDVTIRTTINDADGVDGSVGIRLNGRRRNVTVEVTTIGFHSPADRIFIADEPCNGLDVLIKVDGYQNQKAINDYIDLAAGWTGTFRIVNTQNGAMTTLTKRSAH